jgi:hypothetical protein
VETVASRWSSKISAEFDIDEETDLVKLMQLLDPRVN